MHRLITEDRWEEASQYRQQVREELRAQGLTRREAREAAWEAMIEKSPPLGATASGEASELERETETADSDSLSSEQLEELLERTAGQGVDLIRDIEWIYENLGEQIAPSDAPSGGAWALLEFARRYQVKFFSDLLPKALALKQRLGKSEADKQAKEEEYVKSTEELFDPVLPYAAPRKCKCPGCGYSWELTVLEEAALEELA